MTRGNPPPEGGSGPPEDRELEVRAQALRDGIRVLDEALVAAEGAALPTDFRDRAAARTALIHFREALVAGRRALERLDTALGRARDEPLVFRESRLVEARIARAGSLPPGLSRFVRDRVRSTGFEWTVERDSERGWVLRWKDRSPDGRLLGGGRVVEGPWVERPD